MRTPVLFLTAVVLLGTSNVSAQQHTPGYEQEHEHEAGVQYTCVMHPEVVMDHPGKCPKCGMELVPVKVSKARMPNARYPRSHSEHARPLEEEHEHGREMVMQSSVNLADPMSRESSGTAWVPDSTPMYGRMFMFDDDMLMLHGAIFPRYTNVSTRRGDDRIDAPNWFTAMFSHR